MPSWQSVMLLPEKVLQEEETSDRPYLPVKLLLEMVQLKAKSNSAPTMVLQSLLLQDRVLLDRVMLEEKPTSKSNLKPLILTFLITTSLTFSMKIP